MHYLIKFKRKQYVFYESNQHTSQKTNKRSSVSTSSVISWLYTIHYLLLSVNQNLPIKFQSTDSNWFCFQFT